jgi:predicted nucleotidyltransferase
MGTDELLKKHRAKILEAAARHGASNVRIFGSAAKAEDTIDSDFDLLVDLEPDRSLFDLGGLLMDLQKLLRRKVDVVTENGLHWYIKNKVLQEARPL